MGSIIFSWETGHPSISIKFRLGIWCPTDQMLSPLICSAPPPHLSSSLASHPLQCPPPPHPQLPDPLRRPPPRRSTECGATGAGAAELLLGARPALLLGARPAQERAEVGSSSWRGRSSPIGRPQAAALRSFPHVGAEVLPRGAPLPVASPTQADGGAPSGVYAWHVAPGG